MKDRIRIIMQASGMNASQFADAVGIRRATVTHITTGRNEPSLNVIYKILTKFTDVSPDWLLFGYGEMYRNGTVGENAPKAHEQVDLTLFPSSVVALDTPAPLAVRV